MSSPFSFKGDIGRVVYACSALTSLFLQHAAACAVLLLEGVGFDMSPGFWLNPLPVLARRIHFVPDWLVLLALLLMLLVMWMQLALAYRRTRSTSTDAGWVMLAAIPGVQLLVIAWLTFAANGQREAGYPQAFPRGQTRAIALGLLTGAALCLAAAAFSTLVLRIYGYGLFVLSPLVIGMTVADIANRDEKLSLGRTTALVLTSLALGAIALMGFALEGAVCVVIASPLIAFAGFIGGAIGRAIAEGRRGGRTALMSVAVLPFLLAGEALVPPRADFESVESVDIAATPERVWDSVVHMGPIPGAPAAPFRWGLAYPLSGEIRGEGIGAVRRGVFSTGVAYERVVEWVPEQRLSFIVLSDPPSMRELSPYAHVNAPHVHGYFRTRDVHFIITPLADGRTRLTLATHHDLDLEPALYWLPFARWAVHANKVRVLGHFRQQAEAPRP